LVSGTVDKELKEPSQTFREIPIQQVQSFWNKRPCNLRHSTKPVGSKEYFDEIEARKYFVEPHLVTFADFPSMRGKKVLEIGCGLGAVTIGFARAGAAKVTAVDLSEKSLEIAKMHAEACGVSEKIEFYQANAEKLSEYIPTEKYDLIFSFGVIHHSPNPEAIVKQMKNFLKPGGKLKIMVYYSHSWKVLWILLKYGKLQFWKLRELIARHSEAQTGCPITYAYSKKSGRELLESCGLKVTNIEVDHIFPYRIPDYVQYRYVKVWYFRWMPHALFRFLEKKLGWHLCLTATKADSTS
jgi:2-polyprenyl-3-methyl-5-hydroxy-6-metoxy-1,4-benzoquinol methylase